MNTDTQLSWLPTTEDPVSWRASSATPEWYTEAHVIERVVKVLRRIDLDPCSNPPPYNVPASQHFTREDNGLLQSWRGSVFLNPPYGRELPVWMAKLADEIRREHVTAAITLTPARTDTQWFRTLWQARALCFCYGRMHFGNDDLTKDPRGRAPFPSVIGYFGRNRDARYFGDVFEDMGKVIYP